MAEPGDWKDTLYVWDGIVTKEDCREKSDTDPIALVWEGSWVPILNVPDAIHANEPKRAASKRDLDGDCKFSVQGNAILVHDKESRRGSNGDEVLVKPDYDRHFVASLTEGDGWEMEDGETKQYYKDTTHEIWMQSLGWSGNPKDSLVVARGDNDFGPFVSVGWARPGCRWTIARRYLSANDPRASWSFRKLYRTIVSEAAVTRSDETGITITTGLKIPPWKIPTMHVNCLVEEKSSVVDEGSGRSNKRRKTETTENE